MNIVLVGLAIVTIVLAVLVLLKRAGAELLAVMSLILGVLVLLLYWLK